MNLSDKTRELAEAVKSTKEFIELKQAKAYIDMNKALKSEVEAFNAQQMLLYSGKLSARDAEEKAAQLNRTFGSISKVPEVERFLKASQQFNDILAAVFKSVNESIEKELNAK